MHSVVLVGGDYPHDPETQTRNDGDDEHKGGAEGRTVQSHSLYHQQKTGKKNAETKRILFGRVVSAHADGGEEGLHVTQAHCQNVTEDDHEADLNGTEVHQRLPS